MKNRHLPYKYDVIKMPTIWPYPYAHELGLYEVQN